MDAVQPRRSIRCDTDTGVVMDTMEGHEFEYFCADLLQHNGFTDVEVTQASGDFGIDVLAQKDGVTYAIQCKCYADPVGNHAVQEALSGAQFYHCMVAVVMTNNYFTPAAIETAQRTNVLLWNRDKVLEMASSGNR
ncbi:MAG TPA: restriction endonuclease [Candidatus Gemmiger excrementigallinarum]|uniref:Restriction endonuclease n=1 Tax=Candidatus Gemmiger excrementigallinarum TaxID=2838609 RepID=A0A9D2EQY5_9FIRM|nr:restriction endonuclease [Candidatus Gemmiger excrementigallinarum]